MDALLDPALDPVVRRRVPRVLATTPTRRAAEGLLAALSADRLDVRYRSAQALVRLRQRDPTLVLPAADLVAIASREIDALHVPDDRGHELNHVFAILSLALEHEPLEAALRALRGRDEALRGTALEYLANVLPPSIRDALWPRLGAPRLAPSGRTMADVRDELLRSSARWRSIERRLRSGAALA